VRRSVTVALVLICSSAAPLAAQKDPSLLAPGSRVRVTSSQFAGVGVYQGARADTVVVLTATGEQRRLPLHSIQRLERSLGPPAYSRALRHGALGGAVGGAIGGAAFVALVLVVFCEPGFCDGDDWVTALAVGVGAGGAGGAVIGGVGGVTYAAVRGERWERVALPQGIRFSAAPDGRIGVTYRTARRTSQRRGG
jgi:hypothetical protein